MMGRLLFDDYLLAITDYQQITLFVYIVMELEIPRLLSEADLMIK